MDSVLKLLKILIYNQQMLVSNENNAIYNLDTINEFAYL